MATFIKQQEVFIGVSVVYMLQSEKSNSAYIKRAPSLAFGVRGGEINLNKVAVGARDKETEAARVSVHFF